MNVVAEAVDGEEAVTLSRLRNPTSFSWTSICLAWTACRPLAASKQRFPRTRVIILSTVGDETCRRAAEKYGADAFLLKAPI